MEEEYANSNWEAKYKLVAEELRNLTEEYEHMEAQMTMYKQKYVEASEYKKIADDTMARYVVTVALMEARNSGYQNDEGRKSRASIVD